MRSGCSSSRNVLELGGVRVGHMFRRRKDELDSKQTTGEETRRGILPGLGGMRAAIKQEDMKQPKQQHEINKWAYRYIEVMTGCCVCGDDVVVAWCRSSQQSQKGYMSLVTLRERRESYSMYGTTVVIN